MDDNQRGTMLSLWTRALGTDGGHTARDVPFSLAGGHSLAAAQLIAGIRSELRVEVSLVQLLRKDPTFDQLLTLVNEAAPASDDGLLVPAPERSRTQARAPLSRPMRPVWAFHQLHPDLPAYNVVRVLTLNGRLNLAALRAAATDLSRRHDALRAYFVHSRPGEPELVVQPDTVPVITTQIVHASAPSTRPDWQAEAPEAVEAALRSAGDRPYDMAVAPLWRLHVVYVPELRRTWLMLVMHHLVSDLRASDVVLADLAAAYQHRRQGLGPHTADAPSLVSYLQSAAAQSGALETQQRRDDDLGWWARELQAVSSGRPIPLTSPPASDDCFTADAATIGLDAAIVESLARQFRVTSATVLLTAALTVLGSWRGIDRDVDVVGIPSTGAVQAGEQGLVGFLVDTVPLLCPLDYAAGFGNACATVRNAYLDALEHASCTLGEIMTHLAIPRQSARDSLVTLWFNDLTHARHPRRFDDLDCDEYDLRPGWAVFGFGLYVRRTSSGLRLHSVVTSGTISRADQQAFLSQVAHVVARSAAADPSADLAGLVVPPPSAQSPAPRLTPAAATVELIRRHAQEQGDRPAIRYGGTTETYGQLAARITERSGRWDDQSRVALQAERSFDYVVNVLAAIGAGASVILIGSDWPPERQRLAIELSQATDVAGIEGEAVQGIEFPPREPGHAGTAIQFTSGSTGVPLGVQTSHHVRYSCLEDLGHWLGIRADDRVSFLSGPSHDPSWRDIELPLRAGACLCIPPAHVQRDPGQLLSWLQAERITVTNVTPPLLVLALGAAAVTLPDLRIVLSGGAPLPASLARTVRAAAPRAAIVNGYGCTETPQLLSALRLNPEDDISDVGDLSVGPPFPGRVAAIFTAEHLPCDTGQLGTVWASAPHIADGYLGPQPALRPAGSSRFITDRDGRSWFDTGDLARRDAEGRLHLAGRADRQRLIHGHRVLLDEVEAVARTTDGVGAAVAEVVGRGMGQSLQLFIKPIPGANVSPVEMPEKLRSRLPEAMVPARVIVIDDLKVTGNLKADLPADAAPSPAPVPAELPSGIAAQASALAEVILGSPIRPSDNFFEAGFNSLTLLRFGAELSHLLGREIPAVMPFRYPSLHRLLTHLGFTSPARPQAALVRPAAGDSARDRRRRLRAAIRENLGTSA